MLGVVTCCRAEIRETRLTPRLYAVTQGEREDGNESAAGVARSSPERQQAADCPPDPAVSGATAAVDPSASAARAGPDHPASGQLKEPPPPGPAPSSSPVRIEGIDNPIDLLLDELRQIDIQVLHHSL